MLVNSSISLVLTTREIPLKFNLNFFITSVLGMGDQEGEFRGCWEFLAGDFEERAILDIGWCCFTLRKLLWKFHLDMFIRSVSRMEGSRIGYLEGFWMKTWKTGSSFMSLMMLFYPKKTPWGFSVDFFIRCVSGMGDQEDCDSEDV